MTVVCANPFSPRYPPCLAAVQGVSSIVWRLTTVRRHQVYRALSRLQFEQAFLFTFSHRSSCQPLLTSFYKVPPGSFATAETLWFAVDWTARYALFVLILALVIFSSAYARLGQFINEFCVALPRQHPTFEVCGRLYRSPACGGARPASFPSLFADCASHVAAHFNRQSRMLRG